MAYTVTRKTGYGSRVSNSCGGTLMGFVLFALATALLWWNEGRSVHRSDDIKEVAKTAQSIGDISSINSSHDGQLIHATGTASTQDILTDALFDISTNSLCLIRNAEFYQWKEHEEREEKEKLGGSVEEVITYTYERGWSDDPINSSNFADPDYQNVNTVLYKVDDSHFVASNVNFGTYRLPQIFIDKLTSDMTSSQLKPINPSKDSQVLKDLNSKIAESIDVTVHPEAARATDSLAYIHIQGNQLYIGYNPSSPAIGDVRVTFEQLPASCDMSLIAVPQNGTFTTYKAKHNDKEYELRIGTLSLDEMIEAAHHDNKMLTWLLRLAGAVLVIIALKMIFDIIVTILKVIPFIANIFGWGVGVVCTVLGIVWSLIVIAIAWIFYRPLLGIILLVIAGALIYFFAIKGKNKSGNLSDVNDAGPINQSQALDNHYNQQEK